MESHAGKYSCCCSCDYVEEHRVARDKAGKPGNGMRKYRHPNKEKGVTQQKTRDNHME